MEITELKPLVPKSEFNIKPEQEFQQCHKQKQTRQKKTFVQRLYDIASSILDSMEHVQIMPPM